MLVLIVSLISINVAWFNLYLQARSSRAYWKARVDMWMELCESAQNRAERWEEMYREVSRG